MATGMSEYEEHGTISSSWLANLIEQALKEDHDQDCKIQFTNYGIVVEAEGPAGPMRISAMFYEPQVDDHTHQDKQSICWACQLGEHGRCEDPSGYQWIDERIDNEATIIVGPCLCDHITRPLIWAKPVHELEQQSDGYRLRRPDYDAIERAERAAGWDPTP